MILQWLLGFAVCVSVGYKNWLNIPICSHSVNIILLSTFSWEVFGFFYCFLASTSERTFILDSLVLWRFTLFPSKHRGKKRIHSLAVASILSAHVLIKRPGTHTYVPCLSGSTRCRLVTCFTNHSNSSCSPGTQAKLRNSAHSCRHNGISSLRNMTLKERKRNTVLACFPASSKKWRNFN